MFSGPQISAGTEGAVYLRGRLVGRLAAWDVHYSPTTGKPTLKGRGTFARAWADAVGSEVVAHVTTTPPAAYIGRGRPRPAERLVLAGTLYRLTRTQIIISNGAQG